MKFTTAVFAICATLSLNAQTSSTTSHTTTPDPQAQAWQNPSTGSVGVAPLRTEFISYDIREEAEKGIREVSPFFLPLNMFSTRHKGIEQLRTRVEIPYMWLDRELFLHVEGIQTFYVEVNDKRVGYAQDGRLPHEFNISQAVTNGLNTISLDIMKEGVGEQLETAITSAPRCTPTVFIYSQPKLRIEDFTFSTVADSSERHYQINLNVALANSYNSPEKITFGYDIYSPQGKLLYYDMREVKLNGQGRDTIHFKEMIYGAYQNLWTTQTPTHHKMMLYIKREGRMTEYIPLQAGFGSVNIKGAIIYRNGKPLSLNIASYNGASTAQEVTSELNKLKAHEVNTVILDYPQPWWFYNVCDRVGMNVIDQVNINTNFDADNTNIGGALSNNPKWLGAFMYRLQNTYMRNRNHPSIIGISLGSEVGNGYNMYKCYQWLKETQTQRAVIFRDAKGQWNNDITLPHIKDGKQLIATPAPKPMKKPIARRG